MKFRGNDYAELDDELGEIVAAKKSRDARMIDSSLRSLVSTLASSAFLKPYLCVGGLYTLFRFSIYSVLPSYTATILEDSGARGNPLLGAVFIGVSR